GLAGALQVNKAKPSFGVLRVYGADFDVRDLKTDVTFEGKRLALSILGSLMGVAVKGEDPAKQHRGKLAFKVGATFKSQQELPIDLDVAVEDLDITGIVAKHAPKLLPVLDGATSDVGAQHLPRLTLKTSGKALALWKPSKDFDQDATMNSIAVP